VRFGLTANVEIPDGPRLAAKALKALESQDLVLEKEVAGHFGLKGKKIEDMDVDIMVTVGGDGTILRALMKNRAPIFSINAGELGFLTEVTEQQIEEGIHRIIQGDFLMDERAKLMTKVNGKRIPDATNEAVVHTANIAKIRHFEVLVDGEIATNVRADGIIVSTPTGSIGYAMSVGAPMIDPRVDALVIAPMAPFKFAARPTVVPSTSVITLRLVRPKPCVIVVDGQEEIPMSGDEVVTFSVSENKARFVRFSRSFYKRSREKLMGPQA
jgi:NAD+ kinase